MRFRFEILLRVFLLQPTTNATICPLLSLKNQKIIAILLLNTLCPRYFVSKHSQCTRKIQMNQVLDLIKSNQRLAQIQYCTKQIIQFYYPTQKVAKPPTPTACSTETSAFQPSESNSSLTLITYCFISIIMYFGAQFRFVQSTLLGITARKAVLRLKSQNQCSILFVSLKNKYQTYQQYTMKQRIAYSPKPQRSTINLHTNSSKSPKHTLTSQFITREVNLPSTLQQQRVSKDYQNLKKIPESAFSLRQTMSHKKVEQMFKIQSLQEQSQRGKLGDLLRQTLNHKSSNRIAEKYAKELNTSNDNHFAKDGTMTSLKSLKTPPTKINQSRSSTNLPQSYRNASQFEEMTRKIDQNKKFLEKLRKQQSQQAKETKDYLKNVVQRSASYVNLDQEKQSACKSKKKEEVTLSVSSKDQKGSPLRLNSPEEAKLKIKTNPENAVFNSPQNSPKKLSVMSTSLERRSFLDEFEIGRKLGQGKFGVVHLARHKKSKGVFALKKIQKAVVKSHRMVDQLALQIRIQSCLAHRNVLGMYGFFEDKSHLYIVLQYMDGGTLYQRLKQGNLSEKETAVIIKCMAQAVEYLHDLGIAHRDIKPENVVFSNNVYKLCDFGWAAMCNERRKTYCGTFDYVAPQILEGVDYDMTVDLWCLGVMTYQLLTGKAPFYHVSRKETMKKILNVQHSNIEYPKTMSQTARDFIDKLIRKNPQQRIKANEVLMHPFISHIHFD